MPKSRVEFWREKFETNVRRDRNNSGLLRRSGWRVLIVWECETQQPETLKHRLYELLCGAHLDSIL